MYDVEYVNKFRKKLFMTCPRWRCAIANESNQSSGALSCTYIPIRDVASVTSWLFPHVQKRQHNWTTFLVLNDAADVARSVRDVHVSDGVSIDATVRRELNAHLTAFQSISGRRCFTVHRITPHECNPVILPEKYEVVRTTYETPSRVPSAIALLLKRRVVASFSDTTRGTEELVYNVQSTMTARARAASAKEVVLLKNPAGVVVAALLIAGPSVIRNELSTSATSTLDALVSRGTASAWCLIDVLCVLSTAPPHCAEMLLAYYESVRPHTVFVAHAVPRLSSLDFWKRRRYRYGFLAAEEHDYFPQVVDMMKDAARTYCRGHYRNASSLFWKLIDTPLPILAVARAHESNDSITDENSAIASVASDYDIHTLRDTAYTARPQTTSMVMLCDDVHEKRKLQACLDSVTVQRVAHDSRAESSDVRDVRHYSTELESVPALVMAYDAVDSWHVNSERMIASDVYCREVPSQTIWRLLNVNLSGVIMIHDRCSTVRLLVGLEGSHADLEEDIVLRVLSSHLRHTEDVQLIREILAAHFGCITHKTKRCMIDDHGLARLPLGEDGRADLRFAHTH